MKNLDVRTVASRRVALAAAAAAALTASLAFAGQWSGSSFAAAHTGTVMVAGGGVTPDGGPVPCIAPDVCNVG